MVSRSDFIMVPMEPEREIKLSQALWCDTGKHAFSEKDPDRQHFAQTRQVKVQMGIGNFRGEGITVDRGVAYQERKEVTEELDVCGPCWRKQTLFLEASETDSKKE